MGSKIAAGLSTTKRVDRSYSIISIYDRSSERLNGVAPAGAHGQGASSLAAAVARRRSCLWPMV